MNAKELKKAIEDNVKVLYRKTIDEASKEQVFYALSYAIKDTIIDEWINTHKAYDEQDAKILYYLSMEFLIGRALGNNIINLGARKEVAQVLEELGFDLTDIEDQESDPALGNGGLGRLAACFLDSLATLNYPAYGCGIRYHYGMFKQKIENGYQKEVPDDWIKNGYPFEIKRSEYSYIVKFGGNVRVDNVNGKEKFIQENYGSVKAIPYDMPVLGYENGMVNSLRIWDAEAITNFSLEQFDKGDYQKALEQENLAKTLVEVLYPNDNHYAGKELRLKQQYFFISASLQRALDKFKSTHSDIHMLPDKVVFQLNDTHPTVAIPELMRLLLDEEGLNWDEAWDITSRCMAYTNHTIMSEALEKWPIDLFKSLLPRVYQIVEEINRRFVMQIRDRYPNNAAEKEKKMAILYDGQVRMAYMAIIAGFSVNGVAKLHTQILEHQELKDFYEMMPEKFNNKTNGITFRRWLIHCNHELSEYLNELIGPEYMDNAENLEKLLAYKDDEKVLKKLREIKKDAKIELKKYLKQTQNIDIDENSVFDIQIKRLHEYKRQQMNALYAIYKYKEIKKGHLPKRPITMIFGAKAAPAYTIAKDIIHLILCLQQLVENDPSVSPYLNIVMVENYNVTKLIPACDISEQISLASKEASGTGNMKFMLNGAVTLGTEDGANVEIHELVGDDNIYIFGKKSEDVIKLYETASYRSADIYDNDPEVEELVDFIISKELIRIGDPMNLCRLYKEIVNKDWFMALLDVKDYIKTKEQMLNDYEDEMSWSKKALVNIAKAGFFSSDRTIAEYNKDIWHL